MSSYKDCLSTFAPYGGNMPLFKGDQTDATVTIIQEDSDEGMSVTRISTPPRTETSSLLEAIDQILGLFNPMDKECCDKKDKKPEDGEKENDSKSSEDTGIQSKPKSEDGEKEPSKHEDQ